MLQCPNCHFALEEHLQNDVEIDTCSECGGVWLDAGELEVISNGEAFKPHEEPLRSLSDLRCPRCDTAEFSTLSMEEGTLAQCTVCRGIFVGGATIRRISSVNKRADPGAGRRKAARGAIDAYDIAAILRELF